MPRTGKEPLAWVTDEDGNTKKNDFNPFLPPNDRHLPPTRSRKQRYADDAAIAEMLAEEHRKKGDTSGRNL